MIKLFLFENDFNFLTLGWALSFKLVDISLEYIHGACEELFKPLEELHLNSHDSFELILDTFLTMTWQLCSRFRFRTVTVDHHIDELLLFAFSWIQLFLNFLWINEFVSLREGVVRALMQALVEASLLWQEASLVICHFCLDLQYLGHHRLRLDLHNIDRMELTRREWIIALPVRIWCQSLSFLNFEVNCYLLISLSLDDIIDVLWDCEFVLLIIIFDLCVFHIIVIRFKVYLRLHQLQPFKDSFIIFEKLLVLNDELCHEYRYLITIFERKVIGQDLNTNIAQ